MLSFLSYNSNRFDVLEDYSNSSSFPPEYKLSYLRSTFFFMQDQGLEVIAEGLDTLKNMAHDMNEVSLHDIVYFLVV